MPHRKRTNKPIKTIQYEDEDEEKPNENTNAVQSSRVNRANNRRFAADITAQIGSESDVLSLNALTKRKNRSLLPDLLFTIGGYMQWNQ